MVMRLLAGVGVEGRLLAGERVDRDRGLAEVRLGRARGWQRAFARPRQDKFTKKSYSDPESERKQ